MIRNQWYAILESREMKRGKIIGVTRLGEKMVCWRDKQGKLSVMKDLCPHRGVALSAGRVLGDCIQCPFHGFEFDTSGRCVRIPANGKEQEPPKIIHTRVFPSKEAYGLIFIWWGDERLDYPALPFFDSIAENMPYSTIRDHWNTHYSRAIENQLDVVHLPFVHHNTIGAGGATLVNGPYTQISHDFTESPLIEVWVANEIDHGQTPIKPSEMKKPAWTPSLQFRFPNLWQLCISNDMRVFVAFAPIDNQNTMMYVRQYHRINIPVIKQIFGIFGNLGNLVIIRQDKRVVITQEPKRSSLDMNEKLIPGDGPIIAYRKIREELIRKNS